MAGPTRVEERRRRVVALAQQVRRLVDLVASTEVDDADLDRAVAGLEPVATLLSARTRAVTEPSSAEEPDRLPRLFNPVAGEGSAVAPPMVVERGDGEMVGWVTLGSAYEGPSTYSHGGVTASLLDEVLGLLLSEAANSVVTSRLSVRYRGPVPLGVPLRVVGRVERDEGRRITVVGSIATEGEPDVVLAEAEGAFVRLSPEQVAVLFGAPVP